MAPNDPNRTDADIAAAKQFLGLDLERDELVAMGGGGDDDTDTGGDSDSDSGNDARQSKNELLLQSRRRFDGKAGDNVSTSMKEKEGKPGEGISNGGKAVLLAIALSQIGLFVMMSFDPMNRG